MHQSILNFCKYFIQKQLNVVLFCDFRFILKFRKKSYHLCKLYLLLTGGYCRAPFYKCVAWGCAWWKCCKQFKRFPSLTKQQAGPLTTWWLACWNSLKTTYQFQDLSFTHSKLWDDICTITASSFWKRKIEIKKNCINACSYSADSMATYKDKVSFRLLNRWITTFK